MENPANIILKPHATAGFGLKPNDRRERDSVGKAICHISKIWKSVQSV